MTSLELLQHIKNAPEFKGGDSRYKTASNSSVLYNEDIDKIEKELKVLEILKNKCKIGIRPIPSLYDTWFIDFGGKNSFDYISVTIEVNEEEKQAFEDCFKDE